MSGALILLVAQPLGFGRGAVLAEICATTSGEARYAASASGLTRYFAEITGEARYAANAGDNCCC